MCNDVCTCQHEVTQGACSQIVQARGELELAFREMLNVAHVLEVMAAPTTAIDVRALAARIDRARFLLR